MKRSLLNIRKSEKVRNNTIRAKTKMKDIGYIIKRAKVSYVGHMIRTAEGRLNKILYKRTPYEIARKKGI